MKIGLALGGGGARGFAHLGVIKALRELGVSISCIAGASMGAIIGGIIAADQEYAAEEWINMPDWKKLPPLFMDFHFPWRGILKGKRIKKFLSEMIPMATFHDLHIPFAAIATDLITGEEVVLSVGDVNSAISASFAIPGVFTPVEIGGRVLIDGGFVNPVPVSACRSLGADRVIAIDVNANCKRTHKQRAADISTVSAVENAFRVCSKQISMARYKECPPDLLLAPELRDIVMLDFRDAKEIATQGYAYAMLHRHEIVSL